MTKKFFQDVTHWIAAPSGFGGDTFSTPVTIEGRWEERAELFRTPEGEESVSNAIAYLASDVSLGDYLFLGISIVADPTTLAETFQVRQFHKTPDLRRLSFERRAFM